VCQMLHRSVSLAAEQIKNVCLNVPASSWGRERIVGGSGIGVQERIAGRVARRKGKRAARKRTVKMMGTRIEKRKIGMIEKKVGRIGSALGGKRMRTKTWTQESTTWARRKKIVRMCSLARRMKKQRRCLLS